MRDLINIITENDEREYSEAGYYEARANQGNIYDLEGPPPHGTADDYFWYLDHEFPVAGFDPALDAEWMKDENADKAAQYDEPDYFGDLMDGAPVREPVVCVLVNGKPYLWDGAHRVAATRMNGYDTLPAYVGIYDPQPNQRESGMEQ